MKAFLSYSQLDATMVDAVFANLGAGICQYDREAFRSGATLAEEIFRSLSSSDLFVLFLSRNSVASSWVQYELRLAHDKLARGQLCSVVAFVIDDTDPKTAPDWVKTYLIENLHSANAIARRIRSRVMELSAETGETFLFVGRDDSVSNLKRALARPPDSAPTVLAVCGWDGIGRRTLARKVLSDLYPYLPREYPEVVFPINMEIDDFHRILLDLTHFPTREQWIALTDEFTVSNAIEKRDKIADLIREIVSRRDVLFIIDDNSIITDEGSYQDWFLDVIDRVGKTIRPAMVVIQKRMIPAKFRAGYSSVYAEFIESFSDNDIRTMLGLRFREKGIEFRQEEIDDLTKLMDGHPLNVRFAVEYTRHEGIQSLIRNPAGLLQIKIRRAADILKRLVFNLEQEKIIYILSHYALMTIDNLGDLTGSKDESLVKAINYGIIPLTQVRGHPIFPLKREQGHVRETHSSPVLRAVSDRRRLPRAHYGGSLRAAA